ncbi:nitroreductase family protein [Candidatus Bathyarchaeota archaeon]|nr:nitroreductase family protein [Candidatus Bathyarchaeota archaeon]
MSCINLILNRKSIRKYKKEPIPETIRDKIIEAGRQAPSAANRQPWHFILVTDSAVKDELSKSRFSSFIKDASFIIVGVCLPYDQVSKIWGVVDVTIALQNMVLAAEVQGVGSCWIGGFNENEVKALFNIPLEAKVVALISFGFPDEKPSIRQKKELQEILHKNKW